MSASTDGIGRLRDAWLSDGACLSCGWHALLSEHVNSDDELAEFVAEAIASDGIVRFSCVNKDDDSRDGHRGVEVNIMRSPK